MLIPVFADSVAVYCAFLFISAAGTDRAMDFSFPALFVCASAGVVLNYCLSFRDRTTGFIAALNAVAAAVTEIAVFASPNEIKGVLIHAIAGVLFIVPNLHGFCLARRPMTANAMLTCTELSIMGAVFVFMLQLGVFEIPMAALFLCAAALLLNLFMLSELRATGPVQTRVDAKTEMGRGMLLATIAAVAGAVAVAAVLLLLPACRNAVVSAAGAIRDGAVFVFAQISRFFAFLASLVPPPAPEDAAAPVPAFGGTEIAGDMEMAGLIAFPLPVVVTVGIAVLAAIAILVVRNRKRMLLRNRAASRTTEEFEDGGATLLSILRDFLGRLSEHLRFLLELRRKRHTYEGVFLRISRAAGRQGVRRAEAETPREYLCRVLARIPGETPGRAAAEGLFPDLAARLNLRLYSGRHVLYEAAPKEGIPQVFRAVRAMRKGDL
jgi:hypothetical protein